MPIPLEKFVKQLEDSGILAGETIRDFVPPNALPKDAEELARELIRQKKLTKFQAEEVSRGKGQSLVLGNYVLMEQIGAGGMGQVFKAEHRRMKRIVAVKVLPADTMKDPATVARFEREVEAAAKISHPNIVAAHDADCANGVHFLVMELVEGSDFAALVKKNGPFSVQKAVNFILQAAKGLEAAHKKGIVHRDIKPANLLLDKEGVVKILDMGLARLNGGNDGSPQAELTNTGIIMGTVDYMAPEQALDTKTADARADIYALGCSLYYLLTGKSTYDGDTLMKRLLAHRDQPIPSLRAVRPEVSEKLVAVFQKMVAKKTEDRYQTMTELLVDLETCCGRNEQTVAPQEPMSSSTAAAKTDLFRTILPPPPPIQPNIVTQPLMGFNGRGKNGLLPPIIKWIALGGGAFFMLLAGIVFFLPTKDGVIRVEIDDPQIEVSIKGTDIVLKQADQGKDVTVTPGDRNLVIKRGDFSFETDKLILKKGTNVTVHVELLADQIKVYQGDSLLGQNKLTRGSEKPQQVDSSPRASSVAAADPKSASADPRPDVPGTFTNSTGIEFVRVPKGTAWLGGVGGRQGETKVVFEQDFYLGKYEVTQEEWEKVTGLTPSGFKRGNGLVKDISDADLKRFPVEMVSWEDCQLFIKRLNETEKESGWVYRLPKEVEWEYACRGGPVDKLDGAFDFYFAKPTNTSLPEQANFQRSGLGRTCKVGSYEPNVLGLYDMHGNVCEWCDDTIKGANGALDRMARSGGFWNHDRSSRAGDRYGYAPASRTAALGLRLARVPLAPAVTGWHGWPADAPKPAIAPFDAKQAKQHQEAWAQYRKVPVEFSNTIGMKFVLIPPGEFIMGSTPEDIEAAIKDVGEDKHWQMGIKSEAPQHKVILTQPIYQGVNEVTQAEYEKVMGTNPSRFSPTGMDNKFIAGMTTSGHPVEMVSWNDAAEFCAKLSLQEKLKPFYSRAGETITQLDGAGYRLPRRSYSF